MLAQRRGNAVRLFTRNGYDWTERYPALVAAMEALKLKSCLIDGEIAVCDECGLAVFDRLRYGPRINTRAALYAFDLIELDGEDLRGAPIEQRKRALKRIMGSSRAPRLQLAEHDHGDSADIFAAACKLGCEGIVSKRCYVSGRTDNWIKVKNPSAPAVRREAEEEWGRR